TRSSTWWRGSRRVRTRPRPSRTAWRSSACSTRSSAARRRAPGSSPRDRPGTDGTSGRRPCAGARPATEDTEGGRTAARAARRRPAERRDFSADEPGTDGWPMAPTRRSAAQFPSRRGDPVRNVLGGSLAMRRTVAAAAAAAVALPLTIATAVSATAAPAGPVQAAPVVAAADTDPFDVLVFSKTGGFRHGSIPAGIAAIQQLGEENGFEVTATEDAGAFTDENLAQYEAVVWLSTTGDVLNEEQQAAFERDRKSAV